MLDENEDQVKKLKDQGNACVKNKQYAEAMFHYTHAINIDPKNYSLYSNRSFAFLKMQQYHFAMEDALMTIKLKPDWTKGHFRKAEIEYHTFRFSDALASYGQALNLQPNDSDIMEAIGRTTRSLLKDRKADQQIPWLGAGIGIILGVMIVIADYVFAKKPILSHPLVMALMTISIAMMGFGIAKSFRYFVKCQRKSLLEPPIDLLEEKNQNNKNTIDTETKISDKHSKYSKAQARQRFKKGKT